MSIPFHCVICKGTVRSGAASSHRLGPCGLVVVADVDQDRSEQREQMLFCHFKCLEHLVGKDGDLWIANPDSSTLGEVEKERQEVDTLVEFLEVSLEKHGESLGIWGRVFAAPRGVWQELDGLVPPTGEVRQRMDDLYGVLDLPWHRDPMLVAWLDDPQSGQRVRPGPTRFVVLAIDDHSITRTLVVPFRGSVNGAGRG
jgi:hypothetical protein